LGGQTSVGQAINAAGQVTGSAEIGTHMLHAFLFSGGVMSDVGTFGGTASFGYGINRAGDVVGAAYDAGSAPRAHAFLYHGAASGPEHALLLTASAPVTTTSTTTSSSTSVTTTSTTSTTSTEPATTTSTTTGATTTTSTTVAPSSLHVTDCRAAPGGTALC